MEGQVPKWIWLLYFVVVITIFVIGVSYINRLGNKYQNHNRKALFFVCFFTLFALCYCLNPDFFAYREFAHFDYTWMFLGSDVKDIEAYYYIAFFCRGNYELFRIIIWGGAFFVFYFTCRILKVPAYLSILLLFLLFNDVASYGRVTLAMAIYYLGLSLILEKKWYVIGAIITLSSVFFHHSMVVAVGVLPIIFTPKNKIVQLLLYVAIFVAMFILINRVMGQTDILMEDESLGYYGRKMYSSQNKIAEGVYSRRSSLLGVINDLFRYLVFYIPIIGVFFKINRIKSVNYIPQCFVQISKITFAIAMLATSFLLFYGTFNVLFYRVLYMCMIPIPILLSLLLSHNYINEKYINTIIVFSLVHHIGVYISNIIGLI